MVSILHSLSLARLSTDKDASLSIKPLSDKNQSSPQSTDCAGVHTQLKEEAMEIENLLRNDYRPEVLFEEPDVKVVSQRYYTDSVQNTVYLQGPRDDTIVLLQPNDATSKTTRASDKKKKLEAKALKLDRLSVPRSIVQKRNVRKKKNIILEKFPCMKNKTFNLEFDKKETEQIIATVLKNKEAYKHFFRVRAGTRHSMQSKAFDTNVYTDEIHFGSTCVRTLKLKRSKTYDTSRPLSMKDYKRNKLNTNFTEYYTNSGLDGLVPLAEERDSVFERLYLRYVNNKEYFTFSKGGDFSMDTYKIISDITIDREKNLYYAKRFFHLVPRVIRMLKGILHIKNTFVYNTILYVSTKINSNDLLESNYKKMFVDKFEELFRNYMLPHEVDYFRFMYFIVFFKLQGMGKTFFIDRIVEEENDGEISFYHFRDMYYILYNIGRIDPFLKDMLYMTLNDLPDSLNYLNIVINRFLINTLCLVSYKKNIELDVRRSENKTKVFIYVLENGIKYLDGRVRVETRLSDFLNEVCGLFITGYR